jgi:ABC-type antimicrobial peptide transport system permease subunit
VRPVAGDGSRLTAAGGAIGLAAALLPARRASEVDPAIVLGNL